MFRFPSLHLLRRCAGLSAAILLAFSSCAVPSPVLAHCPPLTAAQIARSQLPTHLVIQASNAIDVSSLAKFCGSGDGQQAVLCTGGGSGKLTLAEVKAVDAAIRSGFEYRDDFVAFGPDGADRWQTNTLCGDCEDYALTVSDALHRAGEGGASMSLMLWLPSPTSAHATLLVQTSDAGVVEISVGEGGEPKPYDPTLGERFAAIRMDGGHLIETLGGKQTVVSRQF